MRPPHAGHRMHRHANSEISVRHFIATASKHRPIEPDVNPRGDDLSLTRYVGAAIVDQPEGGLSMRSPSIVMLLSAPLWCAVALAGEAQEVTICPPGMRLVDADHCCWPGQRYATESRTCRGRPTCPSGMVAAGPTCVVAPAAPPALAPVAYPPPAQSPGYAPGAPPPAAPMGPTARGSAQVTSPCPSGMALVDPAHCCWPGQQFSPKTETCNGFPICPPGLVAVGAACVGGYAPPPQVPATSPPVVPPTAPRAMTNEKSAAGGCMKDLDCKGERICVAGACQEPTPAVAPSARRPARQR